MMKNIKKFIITIIGWSIGIIVTTVVVILCIISVIIDPVKRNLISIIKQKWGMIITKIGVKNLIVYGEDKIKDKTGTLFVSNHQSMFDVYILSALTPPKTSFLSKKEIIFVPFIGLLMKFQGCVFVDRSNSEKAKKSLQEVIKKIKEGVNFIFFAEGTRSKDGSLQPFKPGILKIVNELKEETSIIPVTIVGSHKIMKKGSFLLNRGDVVVIFSDPFPPPKGKMSFEEGEKYLNDLRNVILKNLEKYKEYN